MKTATIQEIKQELHEQPPGKIKELCLRLARFKKENKELLTYLLFEAHDESGYVQSVKLEIDEEFEKLPHSNLHLTKKSIRKVLKSINKYGRYTGTPLPLVEMLIHFCTRIRESGIPFHKSPALEKLYDQQIRKINKVLDSLHEDLRYDYQKKVEELNYQPGKKIFGLFKRK